MKISLIITTYNWPQALDLVLESVARQSRMPDEVVVADDGSGAETARLVASWRAKLGTPLQHVWQENKGFRAGRSRNRGIAAACGDYVIAIDGDMVLHRHFVADHERAAEPRCFVQGVRIPTSAAGGARMLREHSTSMNVFSPGLRRRHLALRSPLLSAMFTTRSVAMRRVKSCNQGYWRSDLITVNGFEEAMVGWGPEDKECVARLLHLGIVGKELRFSALATHLHHPVRSPNGVSPNDALFSAPLRDRGLSLERTFEQHLAKFTSLNGVHPNDALFAATLHSRRTRCERGIDQHLAEFAGGIPVSARPPWGT